METKQRIWVVDSPNGAIYLVSEKDPTTADAETRVCYHLDFLELLRQEALEDGVTSEDMERLESSHLPVPDPEYEWTEDYLMETTCRQWMEELPEAIMEGEVMELEPECVPDLAEYHNITMTGV